MILRFLFCILLFSLIGSAQATRVLCQQKEQAILKEIEYARQHNHPYRVNGLERALNEVRTHCTDDKLRADHAKKITEHEAKVAKREQELREAQEKGNSSKIEKRERKLTEARQALATLKAQPY
ncbi:DUF1090 domain-containing protein [Enterobacteriaceae bacterium LUAb1]